jgi:hypothetical protein
VLSDYTLPDMNPGALGVIGGERERRSANTGLHNFYRGACARQLPEVCDRFASLGLPTLTRKVQSKYALCPTLQYGSLLLVSAGGRC